MCGQLLSAVAQYRRKLGATLQRVTTRCGVSTRERRSVPPATSPIVYDQPLNATLILDLSCTKHVDVR